MTNLKTVFILLALPEVKIVKKWEMTYHTLLSNVTTFFINNEGTSKQSVRMGPISKLMKYKNDLGQAFPCCFGNMAHDA